METTNNEKRGLSGNPFDEINARFDTIESLLNDLKAKPTENKDLSEKEEFLTVPEAAQFLKLSVPTIYTMIHENRIPFMKSAKKCYFLKEDLVAYLKKGKSKSRSEISQEANEHVSKKKGVNHG